MRPIAGALVGLFVALVLQLLAGVACAKHETHPHGEIPRKELHLLFEVQTRAEQQLPVEEDEEAESYLPDVVNAQVINIAEETARRLSKLRSFVELENQLMERRIVVVPSHDTHSGSIAGDISENLDNGGEDTDDDEIDIIDMDDTNLPVDASIGFHSDSALVVLNKQLLQEADLRKGHGDGLLKNELLENGDSSDSDSDFEDDIADYLGFVETNVTSDAHEGKLRRWVHCYVGDSLVRMLGQAHARELKRGGLREGAHFAPAKFDKAHEDYTIYRDKFLKLRLLWRPHLKNLLETNVTQCDTVVWDNFGHEVRDNTPAFYNQSKRLQSFQAVFERFESQLGVNVTTVMDALSNDPYGTGTAVDANRVHKRVMMYTPHLPRFSFAREVNRNITMLDAFQLDQPLFEKLEKEHVVLRTDLLSSHESPFNKYIGHGLCCGHMSGKVVGRFYNVYRRLLSINY
eukprot:scaffold1169_cov367-Prasinococcus_capsulatus_cf.AAC.7